MIYRSLTLEAFDYTKADDVESFSVRIFSSPAGGMNKSEAVTVSLQPDLRKRIRRLEKGDLDLPELIALGEELGDALLPARVRTLYKESRAALPENEGLRMRLMLDAYALADIPWEFCYLGDQDTPADQKDYKGFLGLDVGVSIVRDPVLEQRRLELKPVSDQNLRMVVLLSNPQGSVELDLAKERQNIVDAVAEVRALSVHYCPEGTVDQLQKAMIAGAHIFHYAGHGDFHLEPGVKTGQGSLALTDADGNEKPFSAENLALTLNQRGVRLAVLGACKSGRVDQINAWTGIAPALTRAGIPAVIGMQFSIEDFNAVLFSRSLYQGLAAGQSIDEAVSEGRRSIKVHAGDGYVERDWGAPVLYLRSEGDGILFPRPADAAGAALEAARKKLKSETKRSFEASLLQIDVVSDYKELHDKLHDLQLWMPLIRLEADRLPDGKGALLALRKYERKIGDVLEELKETVQKKNVSAEEEVWVGQLEGTRADFETAVSTLEPNIDLLNEAIVKMGGVLETRPTSINGHLMRALGALRIKNLIAAVQRVLDESIASLGDSEEIKTFREGIKALSTIDTDLDKLMKEHDAWQLNEPKISVVRYAVGHIPAFEPQWAQVKAGTSLLYLNNEEKWAKKMQSDAEAVDHACREKDLELIADAFELFYEGVRTRFFNVDKKVKEKCQELTDIRTKMESI